MKAIHILLAASLISPVLPADEVTSLPDKTAKINYSVGYQIGSDFKYQDIEIRPDMVTQGILDALNDAETLLTPQEMKQVMLDLGSRWAEIKRQKREAQRVELQNISKQFHNENADNPGVVTTETGLQYKVIKEGDGKRPTLSDRVVVDYTGKLVDGTVFDSSYQRGNPSRFKVGGVIKGWTEALQLMQPGAKWQLYIPYDLAYGEIGSPPIIPPYSSLIFDVELISVE